MTLLQTVHLTVLSIPSPSNGVWHLGSIPIRGYALSIILGVIVAIWIGERRWAARGGTYGDIQDLAIWAVPFGLVGGRLYHVATDWKLYFGDGKNPVTALYVWQGGLGIWGAVALGALGIWIAARRKGFRFTAVVDTLAPTVIVAQAIGRWGNWFNQELYGKPTDLPWGLKIDQTNWQCLVDGQETRGADCGTALGGPYTDGTLFHPTYLYEFFWNLGVFGLLLWAQRRFRLGFGRVFALYVMGYTLGRGWIEYLRVDNVQLENVLGLRFNVWTSIVLFVAALAYFLWATKRRPGIEDSIYLPGREPLPATDAETGTATGTATDAAADPDVDGDDARVEGETVDDPDVETTVDADQPEPGRT